MGQQIEDAAVTLEALRARKEQLAQEAKELQATAEELEAQERAAWRAAWTPSKASILALKEYDEDTDEEGWDELRWGEEDVEIKVNDDYTITHVETCGGGEGDGEEYWFVIAVNFQGAPQSFWKFPGWYQSHHGSEVEWCNLHEVTPVEVMVTEWQRKK